MLEDDDDLDYEPPTKPCPVCKGTGKYASLYTLGEIVPCPACQGEGTIENC